MRAAIFATLVASTVAVRRDELMELINPSGNCYWHSIWHGNGTGARTGLHYPDENDTYVPDCQNDLKSEYWRVFFQSDKAVWDGFTGDGPAYIRPRPDGMGLKYDICGRDDEAGLLFQKYDLCTESTAANLTMPLEDALKITNALHKKLVFESCIAGYKKRDVCPLALHDDVITSCDLHIEGIFDAMYAHCDDVRDLCHSDRRCQDKTITASNETVEEMVVALNRFYGISSAARGIGEAWSRLPMLSVMAVVSLMAVS